MQPPWREWVGGIVASHRREAVVVGLVVAVTYWIAKLSIPHVLGGFGDDAVYVALGKAIASGQGYRSLYAAGQPVHLKYPPGLPLLLALVWIVGRSLPIVTWLAGSLSVLASATAAGLIWWIGRSRLGLHPAVALVCALGPFLMDAAIIYFSLPISEPYFVLGWAVTLVLYDRLRKHSSAQLSIALGLTVAATTLVRTEAVAILAGLLLAMLIDRVSWRTVATFLAVALTPLLLWAWVHAHLIAAGPVSTQPDELPYTAWLSVHSPGEALKLAVAALRFNWPVYWIWMAPYISEYRPAGIAVLAVCLALSLAGGIVARRRQTALWCTTLGSAAVVLLWPWPQDRFVFGFLPFAGLLGGVAIRQVVEHTTARVRVLTYAALVLFAGGILARQVAVRQLAYLPLNAQTILGAPYPGQFIAGNTSFISMVSQWVRQHAVPADRVLVESPAAIYLYTGHQAVAASPAQSAIAPDVYERPGHYLASRILDDGVTLVVLIDPVHPLARDVATLYRRCPGVLEYLGRAAYWWAGPSQAYFYRVAKADGCVRTVSGE
jgi:hypothetical protein